MHAHEQWHLVGLDNRLANSPLYSTTIYPKCDHTLYGVLITKTKTLSNTFALISIGFCFSLSSFLRWALDHLVVITIITMIITCSMTWHVPTSLSLHTLSIKVSTRVSSIIQNQTRAFNVQTVPLLHPVPKHDQHFIESWTFQNEVWSSRSKDSLWAA